MKKIFNTPILFLIYNRPELTQKVFDEIKKVKPKKIFVSADGPKDRPGDCQKCQDTKNIINQVDWDCEVIKNYSDVNLGCGRRISSSINWLFSQVEEAIILEDDCIPAPSFFSFCEELLEKYRDDERIMHISGNNFQFGQSRTEYSYYFSRYTHCWGWATWRRAWQCYDFNIKTWPAFMSSNLICSICEDPYEQKYWVDIFNRTFERKINTWDYQWLYSCWLQSGLSILPNVNLVSNIGFRHEDSTHCKGDSPFADLPTFDIWDIKYPPFVVRNQEADAFTFDYHYGGKHLKERDTLKGKMRNYLNIIKKKIIKNSPDFANQLIKYLKKVVINKMLLIITKALRSIKRKI